MAKTLGLSTDEPFASGSDSGSLIKLNVDGRVVPLEYIEGQLY